MWPPTVGDPNHLEGSGISTWGGGSGLEESVPGVCVCVWFEPTQSPVLRHYIPGQPGFLLQIHSCPRVTTETAWNLGPHSRNSGQNLAKVPSLYLPIL